MQIELRGIVQRYEAGHKHVEVVVDEGAPGANVKHVVGVDVKVNRGMILRFLSDMYGISAGEIGWPPHITAKDMKK